MLRYGEADQRERPCPMSHDALLMRLGIKLIVIVTLPRSERLIRESRRKPHRHLWQVGSGQHGTDLAEETSLFSIQPLPVSLRHPLTVDEAATVSWSGPASGNDT
jgi:hypothetical protein